MPFEIRNLGVLCYANGFTLWHYKAGDEKAAKTQDNFFAPAGDMLNLGDMIMVSGTEGGRVLCVAAGERGLRTQPI